MEPTCDAGDRTVADRIGEITQLLRLTVQHDMEHGILRRNLSREDRALYLCAVYERFMSQGHAAGNAIQFALYEKYGLRPGASVPELVWALAQYADEVFSGIRMDGHEAH